MAKVRKNTETRTATEPTVLTANHGVVNLRVSRTRALLAGALAVVFLLGVGAAGVWLGRNLRHSGSTSVTLTATAAKTSSVLSAGGLYAAAAGPWGDLECQAAMLEPPEECLAADRPAAGQTTWFFRNCSPAQVQQVLRQTGLSATELAAVGNTNQWRIAPGGTLIMPPAEAVLALATASRRNLYAFLGQFPENAWQREPFYWPKERSDALFDTAPQISSATRTLVKQLAYPHGQLWLFADLPAVLSRVRNEPEKIALQKVLSRQPAIFLKLLITPATDIDALLRYWGVGGGLKYAEPGLEALAKLPEGRQASILGVLPPFARQRLYTFPNAADPGPQDGLWTAFNFFKEQPDAPTTDGSYWKRKLESEYYPVFSDPRFGDILLLTNPGGAVLQACVFLADNLVFAKASARPAVPWTIMRLADLEQAASVSLAENERPQVSYFRSKSF